MPVPPTSLTRGSTGTPYRVVPAQADGDDVLYDFQGIDMDAYAGATRDALAAGIGASDTKAARDIAFVLDNVGNADRMVNIMRAADRVVDLDMGEGTIDVDLRQLGEEAVRFTLDEVFLGATEVFMVDANLSFGHALAEDMTVITENEANFIERSLGYFVRSQTAQSRAISDFVGTASPYGPYGVSKPVVIDLDRDGIELRVGPVVRFDVDGDGYAEETNWVGRDDGLLVIDLERDGSRGDGDGQITRGREINFTLWDTGGVTDMAALAQARDSKGRRIFDQNGDGHLSAKDDVWDELRIWRDRDGDAWVDPGELKRPGDYGITMINVTYDNQQGYAYPGDDLNIGGAKVHGLASVWRNGVRDFGAAADVSLIYEKSGIEAVDTRSGFELRLEGGARYNYRQIDGGAANLSLPSTGLDGAIGDKRGNVLDAQKASRSVMLDGSGGDDKITGSRFADALFGGSGQDVLAGRGGADAISGGVGNDFLNGEAGNDELRGGSGSDQFYHAGVASHGRDWIADFGSADVLVFGTAGAKIKASDFVVSTSKVAGRGSYSEAEVHIKYKPTGQVLWSLTDAADVDDIDVSVLGSSVTYDLV